MARITVTDDETFKLIRANLGDRYSTGFPILKELVQNAEDAGARELRFVLCPGWPEATHPLLQHPGMLVANDGDFRKEHGDKMLSFANSSKAGDAGAIGRFGFGQKAVFHFCDAFIIHAFGHEEAFTEVANPCLGLSFVAENCAQSWEASPSETDVALLRQALGEGFVRGLLLWIPFRNEGLMAAKGLSFTSERPSAEALARDIRAESAQLTLILAASRNLRRILVLDGQETIFDQAIAPGSGRLSKVDACGSVRSLTGELTGPGAKRYCALETRTMTPDLLALKARADWPKTMGVEQGVYKDLPEKAEAHAALVLVAADETEAPVLRMDWGVFLPIGRGEGTQAKAGSACEIALPKGMPSLHLLLHGYFFIDTGRRYVQGFGPAGSSATPKLEELWNQTLRDQVLLPQLPRLLSQARTAGILDDDGLTAVLQALRKSAFWSSHHRAIVSAEGLGRVARQGNRGQALAEFALLARDARLAPVPASEQGRLRFAEALPEAIEIAASRNLTLLSDPGAALPPSAPRWTKDDLQAVLRPAAAVFRQGTAITALVDFLAEAIADSVELSEAATPPVLLALRKALAGDANLPANDDLRTLFGLLRPQRCLGMSGRDNFDRRLLKAFAESDSPCMVVRGSWLPEGAGRSALELPEAKGLLQALSPFLGGSGDYETGLEAEANAASLMILAKMKSLMHQALESESFARIPVMRLDDQNGKKLPVSLSDLRRASEERSLFLGTPLTNQVLPLLSKALPRAKFLVLRNNNLQDLDLSEVVTFGQPSKDVIADLVRSSTTLGDEEDRIALMKHLGLGEQKYRAALRMLATGRTEARNDAIKLRVMARSFHELDGLMSRLGDHVQDVVIVSSRVAGAFGADDMHKTLSISEFVEEDVVAGLECHADLLPKVAPTPEEIAALFRLRIERDRLARLPLFTDADGQLCPAYDLVRETSALRVPQGLRPHVRFAHAGMMAQIPGAYCEAIPAWTHELQISTALAATPFPSRAEVILDALDRLGKVPDAEALRRTAWLADEAGRGFAPGQVLDLPDNVAEAAARLLPAGKFLRRAALPAAVRAHRALAILQERGILPDRMASLQHLLGLVAEEGAVALLPGQGPSHAAALAVLAQLGLRLDLPGWPLLSCLLREEGLCNDLDPTTSFARLDFAQVDVLREALGWVQALGQDRKGFEAALAIFADVLAGLHRQPEAVQHQVLRGLKVPTKAGGWALAEDVAARASGIGDACLLHPDLASAWPEEEADPIDDPERLPAANPVAVFGAEVFAKAVRAGVPAQLLYLFFSLIGIDPKAVCGPHTADGAGPEEIRDSLIEALQSFAASRNAGKFDVFLRQYRVILQPAKPGLVRCKSLAGTWVDLPQDAAGSALLRGNGHQHPVRQGQERVVTLTYDGAILAPGFQGDLIELISAAIPVIAREALGIGWEYIDKLTPLVDKARNVDQSTVEATIRRLVSVLPLMLKQVKPREGGVVKKAFGQAEKAFNALARKGDDPDKRLQVEKRLYEALQSPAAQDELLVATRGKITDMGYSPKRILFELFQNADDAAVQAKRQKADFRVLDRAGEGLLDIVHWGRPINDFSLDPERGREMQYDSDLLNMLHLNTSAKEEKDGVTGHFGLGFKSVHLIAGSVYLGSGLAIATRITGGFLPGPWPEGRAAVRALSTPEAQATLIRLKLDPACQAEARQAMHVFRKAVPVLPALGRAIRHIEIDGTRFDCNPGDGGITGLTVFSVTSADDLRILGMPLGDRAVLLVRLDEQGPVDFDPEIAGLWSLAPLEEDLDSGWILNIPNLPLDPGRTRLKEDPEARQRRFGALGHELAKRLISLHDHCGKDWPKVAETLHLNPAEVAEGQAVFWRRLVQLFKKDLEHPLTSHMHGADRGIGRLIRERAILSSGLVGVFAGLVSGQDAQFTAVGELAKPDVQEAVSTWPSAQAKAGRVISAEYAERLVSLGLPRPRELRLPELLEEEMKRDPRISPKRAMELGALLGEERLKAVREQSESDALRNHLGTGLFEMADGSYRKAYLSPQLAPRDKSDEEHLLPFAPPAVVGAPGYAQKPALDIYRLASDRAGMSRSAETYAKWIEQAQDSHARRMGLRYLLEGNLGDETAKRLREALPLWVGPSPEALRSNSLLADWSEDDRLLLSILLFPGQVGRSVEDTRQEMPPTVPARELLQDILRWWGLYGSEAAAKVDRETYPQGFDPKRLAHFDAEGDREGWFTFFALGSLQSIGRTVPGAHQSFIEEAMARGWWSRIAANGVAEEPDAWLDWLEDVATPGRSHIRHLVWHRRIVDLHLISTYLPDYVTAFSKLPALVARKGRIDLADVMALSTAPDWQRLGLEGGPLKQSLGIGLNWMIREAVRHGLWTPEESARMHPYGWASTAKLRRLLGPYGIAGLGQSADLDASRAIHGFVLDRLPQDASFGGALDLPLQLAATQGSKLRAYLDAEGYEVAPDLMTDDEEGYLE